MFWAIWAVRAVMWLLAARRATQATVLFPVLDLRSGHLLQENCAFGQVAEGCGLQSSPPSLPPPHWALGEKLLEGWRFWPHFYKSCWWNVGWWWWGWPLPFPVVWIKADVCSRGGSPL